MLEAAEAYARAAGERILEHAARGLRVDAKADGTPVTAADRDAEALIRRLVQRDFPDHGVLGEELGELVPDARVRWIIDPIDGTKSYVRGVPLHGVLIGVEVDRQPVVGVVFFPVLDELVCAARGYGCHWNGEPARVSETSRLDEAVVLTTSLGWAVSPSGARFAALASGARFARTWGDCYGHVLVATGRADVMVDPVLAAWDAGPLLTIVTEAGGRFTDLGGTETILGGSGVSTNGRLHARTLEILSTDP